MTDELTEAERSRGGSAGGYNPWVHVFNEEHVTAILADRLAVARAEALTEAADELDERWGNDGRHPGIPGSHDRGGHSRWLRARAAAVARDGEGL